MATTSDAPPAPAGTELDEAELERWVQLDGSETERRVRAVMNVLVTLGFRLRTYGREHVPDEGAFLFVPNHSSWWDPFLQAHGQPRIIRYMAKSEVLGWPVAGRIVSSGGGFPIRRGRSDAFALELARRMLADGQPVAVWPEGTRYRDDARLGPPRRGAARLALETGAPVIPVATWGAKPRSARGEGGLLPRLPKVTTVYGPPMRFDHLENTRENVDVVRDEIWAEVGRLYELARAITTGTRRRPRELSVPPRPSA